MLVLAIDTTPTFKRIFQVKFCSEVSVRGFREKPLSYKQVQRVVAGDWNCEKLASSPGKSPVTVIDVCQSVKSSWASPML